MEYRSKGKNCKCEKIKSTMPGYMKRAHRSKEWKKRWNELSKERFEAMGLEDDS